MRISDWSSDVCSSDLVDEQLAQAVVDCVIQRYAFGADIAVPQQVVGHPQVVAKLEFTGNRLEIAGPELGGNLGVGVIQVDALAAERVAEGLVGRAWIGAAAGNTRANLDEIGRAHV